MYLILAAVLAITATTMTLGQTTNTKSKSDQKAKEECQGQTYEKDDLSKRATYLSILKPSYTDRARKNNITGVVKLRTVLCQSGRVTNIEVIQGLPFGLTEEAIKVARKIKFKPAEKDGQPASERSSITYTFSPKDF